MENQSQQQPPVPQVPFGTQPAVPNSTSVLVLGIISIVFSVLWCYWLGSLVAVVLGIIALVLTKGSAKIYNQNPTAYSRGSFNNMNAGKICAIIGLVLGGLAIVVLIVLIAAGLAIGSTFSNYPW